MAGFSTPRGTQDILPQDWPYWNHVIRHAEEVAHLYGYGRIETPTFAEAALFQRTSGQDTDVGKEMYVFQDRGGDELALRAEGTAPVVRAYLQHGMSRWPQPVKLWYIERVYRYDRPQHGRFREHHQFGCEAIGSEDAYVDVEMIALLDRLYRRLGLERLSLQLNSIGDLKCRPQYVRDLVSYLRSRQAELPATDAQRLERNPLRVLDSKEERTQELLSGAPGILDYLCDDCRAHWQKVLHGLDVLGIEYQLDSRLVRGLDYYTRTVFEFTPAREGAQSAVGGGGRYDALSEAMGGPPLPGVGFGSGIERLVLNLRERGVEVPQPEPLRAYIVRRGEGTEDAALALAERLRRADLPVEITFGDRSLNAQMRRAGGSGARFAAIIGESELAEGRVTVKWLSTGEEETVPAEQVENALRP